MEFTQEVRKATDPIYQKISKVMPEIEWSVHAPYIHKINKLKKQVKVITDSLESSSNADYFSLQGNENAISYIESLGFEALEIETFVSDYIYDLNLKKGNNRLVPYEGINGDMKINKLKFLNHKWILADYTDGRYWGEMVLEYYVKKNREIELKQISSLMYPIQ